MIDLTTYYEVLEIRPGATAEEIRQAYLDLAKVWHPDRYDRESDRLREKAHQKLTAINEAYERLRSCGAERSQTHTEDQSTARTTPPQTVWPKPLRFGADLWGYVDAAGKIVIAPQFASAQPFYCGRALVESSRFRELNRFGYIDPAGQYITKGPLDAGFPFCENLAAVKIDGSWGYINLAGKLVVKPIYRSAANFSESRAAVLRFGHKWGFINTDGRLTTPEVFDHVEQFRDGWSRCRIADRKVKVNLAGEIQTLD